MSDGLTNFAESIAKLGLSEVGCATALLWFLDQSGSGAEHRPAALAEMMHSLSLRGQINKSRLAKQLFASKDVMRGQAAGTVTLRLVGRVRLNERYMSLIDAPTRAKVEPHIVPLDLFEHTSRKYFLKFAHQINGCYQFGFYDSCAVLCRRLMECLLILSFEQLGHKGYSEGKRRISAFKRDNCSSISTKIYKTD